MSFCKHTSAALLFARAGALATTLVAPASYAAYYEFTASIHTVATADPALWGQFDYLLLDGVTSAGNCYVEPNSGKVLIILPTPKAYATALAAQSAGRQVQVSLDDTRRDSAGNCIMRVIRLLE